MNKDYFKRFDTTEQNEADLEARVPLRDVLSLDGPQVLLEGKPVFTVPIKSPAKKDINVAILREDEPGNGKLYLGTGGCCCGHFYSISIEDNEFKLMNVLGVDFNIYDIAPIDHRESLVMGYGCAGAGVRLVDPQEYGFKEIIGKEKFNEFKGTSGDYPSFVFEEENIGIGFSRGKGKPVLRVYDITPDLEANKINPAYVVRGVQNFVGIK